MNIHKESHDSSHPPTTTSVHGRVRTYRLSRIDSSHCGTCFPTKRRRLRFGSAAAAAATTTLLSLSCATNAVFSSSAAAAAGAASAAAAAGGCADGCAPAHGYYSSLLSTKSLVKAVSRDAAPGQGDAMRDSAPTATLAFAAADASPTARTNFARRRRNRYRDEGKKGEVEVEVEQHHYENRGGEEGDGEKDAHGQRQPQRLGGTETDAEAEGRRTRAVREEEASLLPSLTTTQAPPTLTPPPQLLSRRGGHRCCFPRNRCRSRRCGRRAQANMVNDDLDDDNDDDYSYYDRLRQRPHVVSAMNETGWTGHVQVTSGARDANDLGGAVQSDDSFFRLRHFTSIVPFLWNDDGNGNGNGNGSSNSSSSNSNPTGSTNGTNYLSSLTSFSSSSSSSSSTPRQSTMDAAAAAIIALHHFNNGVSDVIPAMGDVSSRCRIRFTLDFIDSNFSPIRASREFIDDVLERDLATTTVVVSGANGGRVGADNNGDAAATTPKNTTARLMPRSYSSHSSTPDPDPDPDLPYPTALIGASRSAVSVPLAILSGVHDMPQISYASTSTVLNNKDQFPLFGRLVPSAEGDANAAVEYLSNLGVKRVGVLFVRDEYGSTYAQAIQEFATHANIQVHLASFAFDGANSDQEMSSAIRGLAVLGEESEYDLRYFVAIIFEHQHRDVMSLAYQYGIAGYGHFWMFGDAITSILGYEFHSVRDRDLIDATHGSAVVTTAFPSTRKGRPEFEAFLTHWHELTKDESGLRRYFDSKMPEGVVRYYDDDDDVDGGSGCDSDSDGGKEDQDEESAVVVPVTNSSVVASTPIGGNRTEAGEIATAKRVAGSEGGGGGDSTSRGVVGSSQGEEGGARRTRERFAFSNIPGPFAFIQYDVVAALAFAACDASYGGRVYGSGDGRTEGLFSSIGRDASGGEAGKQAHQHNDDHDMNNGGKNSQEEITNMANDGEDDNNDDGGGGGGDTSAGKRWGMPMPFDGRALFQSFLRTDFDGLYGRVKIDPATGSREYITVPYSISNLVASEPGEDGMVVFNLVTTDLYEEDGAVDGGVVGDGDGDGDGDGIAVGRNAGGNSRRGGGGGRWRSIERFTYSGLDHASYPGGVAPQPPVLPPYRPVVAVISIGAQVFGWVLCGISTLTSMRFASWTFVNRNHDIVKASQPFFLGMLCLGGLLMGCTILPMSLQEPAASKGGLDAACIATPWLFSFGFIVAFSALFSKTIRVNKISRSRSRHNRIAIKALDVMKPFMFLFVANLAVLISWTVVSPLSYVYLPSGSVDNFGRPRQLYAACHPVDRGWDDLLFVLLWVAINISALLYANFQAYQGRCVLTEYSESAYICVSMAILLQGFVIGVPVMVVVDNSPTARFVLRTCLVFVTVVAVLFPIFAPKIRFLRQWKEHEKRMERKIMLNLKKQRQMAALAIGDGSLMSWYARHMEEESRCSGHYASSGEQPQLLQQQEQQSRRLHHPRQDEDAEAEAAFWTEPSSHVFTIMAETQKQQQQQQQRDAEARTETARPRVWRIVSDRQLYADSPRNEPSSR